MHLETERLILRPFTPGDLPDLLELHADPEVTRYLHRGDWPPELSKQWLERTLLWERELGLGQLAVVRRSDGRFIGRAGLTPWEVDQAADTPRCFLAAWDTLPPDVFCERVLELGYTFRRDVWGQGFASEAAGRVRDWAFAERLASALACFIHPENSRSIRVALKLGFAWRGSVQALQQKLRRYVLAGPGELGP